VYYTGAYNCTETVNYTTTYFQSPNFSEGWVQNGTFGFVTDPYSSTSSWNPFEYTGGYVYPYANAATGLTRTGDSTKGLTFACIKDVVGKGTMKVTKTASTALTATYTIVFYFSFTQVYE
jgi:hypothetical protein